MAGPTIIADTPGPAAARGRPAPPAVGRAAGTRHLPFRLHRPPL